MFYPEYSGYESRQKEALVVVDRADVARLSARVGDVLRDQHGFRLVVDLDAPAKPRLLRRAFSDCSFALLATTDNALDRATKRACQILSCGTPVLVAADRPLLPAWRLSVPYDHEELLALATRAAMSPDWIASFEGRALRYAQGLYSAPRRMVQCQVKQRIPQLVPHLQL